MKRLILGAFLLSLAGCAWLGEQVDYQKLCQQDPVCLEDAKKDAELAKTIVGIAYPVAAAPVGAAVLALALWFRGRKKEKK